MLKHKKFYTAEEIVQFVNENGYKVITINKSVEFVQMLDLFYI